MGTTAGAIPIPPSITSTASDAWDSTDGAIPIPLPNISATRETNGIILEANPIPLPITFAASATQCRADRGLGVRFGKGKNRCSKAQNRGV